MNPLRSDTDSNLLFQVAQTAKQLLTLQMDQLTSLAAIFHIPTADKMQSFEEIRKVLCDVLMIERHYYEEYLQLPKFRKIRPETVQKISMFLQYVWLNFLQKKEEEKDQLRRTMLNQSLPFTPNTDTSKDSRLGCYNYYPAYEPYQKFNIGMANMGINSLNAINQPKMTYSPYPYYYNFQNYQYPQNYGQQGAVPKYNDYFRSNEKDNQPVQEQSQSSAVVQPDFSNNKLEEEKHNGEVLNKNQPSQSMKGEAVAQQESNIIDLQFLHCACLGKNISSEQKYFQCPDCTNLYHFACLSIQSTEAKSCPLCTLTKNHIFTECYARPIKSGWLRLQRPMDLYINKLRLEQDEMKIFLKYLAILESGTEQPKVHSIQFRILKINDKGKVKGGKRIVKITFPISITQLKKLEMRKWIQLKLKSIIEPTVAFYVMIMVKAKSRERIIEDYKEMENSGDIIERWRQEQRKEGKKVELSMAHPYSKRIIELPVRGEYCDHLQCEDLLHLYSQFQSSSYQTNNKLQCCHCKKIYTPHSKFTNQPALHALLQTRLASRSLKLSEHCLEWTASPQQHSQPQDSSSFS